MDYNKIYDNLISSRLSIKEERIQLKKDGFSFERHHIIPKCKGGSNDHSNIVYLTPREHFLSHWLLWLMYRDRQMALAFHKMTSCSSKQKRILSSRDYEKARDAYVATNIGNKYGAAHKGRKVSQKQKDNHSIKMKGKFLGDKNPFYGKTHTKEAKEKIANSRKPYVNDLCPGYLGLKDVYMDGSIVFTGKSVGDVADFIDCSKSNVYNVLGGNQKTAKGYVIKHRNEQMD